jgi:hypothetical protein
MSKKSITYTWKVTQLDRETTDGFVFTAHYTVGAANGTYTAGAYGSQGFERPESLVPYSDLTEETVLTWLKTALTDEKVTEIEAALKQQIDEQVQPTKAAGVPW